MEGFNSWLASKYAHDMLLLPEVIKCLEQLSEKICNESLKAVLNDPACSQLLGRFTEYLDMLRSTSGILQHDGCLMLTL